MTRTVKASIIVRFASVSRVELRMLDGLAVRASRLTLTPGLATTG